jgi:hypothetical protein
MDTVFHGINLIQHNNDFDVYFTFFRLFVQSVSVGMVEQDLEPMLFLFFGIIYEVDIAMHK